MQIDFYKKAFQEYFDQDISNQIMDAVRLIRPAKRILFIGNGGSNAISSHMMEDYMKIASKQTMSFTDPALITCFANDYGYEKAMEKWIEFSFQPNDVLIAISSSGQSPNILNAANMHKSLGGVLITLSGFKSGNSLSELGKINFHVPFENYGIVECFHQIILHAILDEL